MRALFEACDAHDLPAVEALVDSWHQNQSSSSHPTLLIGALEQVFHHAVRLDDAPITSFLLDAGIAIDRMTIMEATDVQVQFGKSFSTTGGTSVYRWNKSDHLHSRMCPPYPTSARYTGTRRGRAGKDRSSFKQRCTCQPRSCLPGFLRTAPPPMPPLRSVERSSWRPLRMHHSKPCSFCEPTAPKPATPSLCCN